MSEASVRIARLARSLTVQTIRGEANWVQVPNEETVYELRLNSGTIRLGSVDRDGAAPYWIATFSNAGGDALDYLQSNRAAAVELRDLYEAVDRRARGADAVLDNLLKEVDPNVPTSDDIPF